MEKNLHQEFLTQFKQCAMIYEKVNVLTNPNYEILIPSEPNLLIRCGNEILQEAERKKYTFLDQDQEGKLYFTLGRCHYVLSNLEEALRCYTHAMLSFEKTGNVEMEAKSLSGIGGVYEKAGDFTTAYDYTHTALEKALKTGNKLLEARLQNDIGYSHVTFGEYRKAMEYLNPCVQYLENADDPRLLSFAKDSIAQAYLGIGEVDKAFRAELEAIELAKKEGNWYGVAAFMSYLAQIYKVQNRIDEAINCLDEAQTLSKQRGYEMEELTALKFKGDIYRELRNEDLAIQHYVEAVEIARRVHATRSIYEIFHDISQMYKIQQKFDQALKYFELYHQYKEEAMEERNQQEKRYRDVIERASTARREADLLQIKNAELENEIRERIDLSKRLDYLAKTDSLTGLLNRRAFFSQAALEYERANRYRRKFSIILIDLDYFKQINDTHGHQAGDHVLQVISDRLKNNMRANDLICRFGGDEFFILLPETDIKHAGIVGKLLQKEIATPIPYQQTELQVNACIGISSFEPRTRDSIDKLIEKADKAMYAGKQGGRNRVLTFSDEMLTTS
ncbi:MAG: diguanylate cyclase [Anaerolineaceae bacterium]|nr:diguanylate cyclase [Anaerolineaceae bacterium]